MGDRAGWASPTRSKAEQAAFEDGPSELPGRPHGAVTRRGGAAGNRLRAERDGRRRDPQVPVQDPAYRPAPPISVRRQGSSMVYGRRSMDIGELRRIPLFQDLDDEALKLIGDLANEFEEPAGWILVEVGQPGSGMFVLEEGTVEVQTPNGRRWEYGPGEFFGELAVLTDHPRNDRVQAKTPVKCLAISRRDFSQLIKEEPEIAVAMLPKLATRIDSPH